MTPTAHAPLDISSASGAGLQLLLQKAAVWRLETTGWIRVTGTDRVRWLNGMATNHVQQLADGAGTYNFFLNAQGRIQGDGYIFVQPDALLIETQTNQIPTLVPYLDHYIIMDDVELKDVSDAWSGLGVVGPQSLAFLSQAGLDVANLKPLGLRETSWNTGKVSMIHGYSPLVPRYEIWADHATIHALFQALQSTGASSATPESLEALRILEGTPRYGVDIRDRDLPQETNQVRALHFAKGCYLGQEIVERIRSRGSVHRIFQAFRLEGELPVTGTTLEATAKPAGELTSVAAISIDGKHLELALGYIRREALERNQPITYPGGTAMPIAAPFRPDEANPSNQASESSERK